jgi:predicted O-methyltransferase YrrM
MAIEIRGKALTIGRVARYLALLSLDGWRAVSFCLDVRRRRKLKSQFSNCRSLEDYFQFAQQTIGLTQHRTEILGLLEYVGSTKPRYVCEIGTYRGGTNLLIAQAIPTVRIMVGLDLYVQQKSKLNFFCHDDRKLHYVNGSSYDPTTVQKVLSLLGGKQLDFLFIDGDHHYEGLKRDFLSYRNLVKDGGIIAFHDIVRDRRMRFGRESDMWVGDVPIFWSRVKNAYCHREFVENPHQDGLGIGAIIHYKDIPLPTGLSND